MRFRLEANEKFFTADEAIRLARLGFAFTPEQFDSMRTQKLTKRVVEIDFQTLDDLIEFSRDWNTVMVFGDDIELAECHSGHMVIIYAYPAEMKTHLTHG